MQLKLGLIHQPLEFLLFSDFAAVLAYTHLYALFMVTLIFNAMVRIDRCLLEAALDHGAGWWRTVTTVVLLAIVLMMIAAILRIVDIQREL